MPDTFHSVVFTGGGIPPGHEPVVGSSEDLGTVFAKGEGGYGLVVALDDPQGFGGIVYVQVADEAAQGYR